MNWEKILIFYKANNGGINGAIIGAMLAVFILVIGPLNTLFIAIFSFIGYYIGKKLSTDKDYIKKFLDKVLPPGTYR